MSDNQRTYPISGRIAEEDYVFLMEQPLPGKVTASEKLRHMASFYRRYHESMSDYGECLTELERLFEPFRLELKRLENDEGTRSELLDRVLGFLPELSALLITAGPVPAKGDGRAYLSDVEERVCRTVLALLEGVLRMGLTRRSPTYNPQLLRGKLDTIEELAGLLAKVQSE